MSISEIYLPQNFQQIFILSILKRSPEVVHVTCQSNYIVIPHFYVQITPIDYYTNLYETAAIVGRSSEIKYTQEVSRLSKMEGSPITVARSQISDNWLDNSGESISRHRPVIITNYSVSPVATLMSITKSYLRNVL